MSVRLRGRRRRHPRERWPRWLIVMHAPPSHVRKVRR